MEARDSFDRQATPLEVSAPTEARSSKLSDLLPRLTSGLVLMALALTGLWFGGAVFILLWLAATLALFWEWQSIIDARAKIPRLVLGFGFLVLVTVLAAKGQGALAGGVLVVASGLLILLSSDRRLWTGGGLLYAGCFILALCLLMSGLEWRQTILWLFAIVWGTDVCAYFGGRLVGGPKIWPQISPKKTWSGTVIGVTCGAAIGTSVHLKFDTQAVSILGLMVLSLATAVVSQAGDMFESWMKRRFNVKDSSHLIPGHGGFLDRLDGFVAAVAFTAIVGAIFGGGSG